MTVNSKPVEESIIIWHLAHLEFSHNTHNHVLSFKNGGKLLDIRFLLKHWQRSWTGQFVYHKPDHLPLLQSDKPYITTALSDMTFTLVNSYLHPEDMEGTHMYSWWLQQTGSQCVSNWVDVIRLQSISIQFLHNCLYSNSILIPLCSEQQRFTCSMYRIGHGHLDPHVWDLTLRSLES